MPDFNDPWTNQVYWLDQMLRTWFKMNPHHMLDILELWMMASTAPSEIERVQERWDAIDRLKQMLLTDKPHLKIFDSDGMELTFGCACHNLLASMIQQLDNLYEEEE